MLLVERHCTEHHAAVEYPLKRVRLVLLIPNDIWEWCQDLHDASVNLWHSYVYPPAELTLAPPVRSTYTSITTVYFNAGGLLNANV